MLLGVILGAILSVLALSWLLKYLWNTTMPDVFSLPKVSYWQAFRLMIIGVLLFSISSVFISLHFNL